MQHHTITNHRTEEILFKGTFKSFKRCIEQAVLDNTDLENADLSYKNLQCANIDTAKLSGAKLHFTNLNHANISEASLSFCDFSGASLIGTCLAESDLSGSNFTNRENCEDLHDYVLFMANTGLRPDEAGRLEYRDVTIVTDQDSGERLLEIEVRGKRGVGYCKSMPSAVHTFQRLQKRHKGQPLDKIFGKTPRLLNTILEELGLKYDRDGNVRL